MMASLCPDVSIAHAVSRHYRHLRSFYEFGHYFKELATQNDIRCRLILERNYSHLRGTPILDCGARNRTRPPWLVVVTEKHCIQSDGNGLQLAINPRDFSAIRLKKKKRAFEMKTYRRMLGISWNYKKTNEWVRSEVRRVCGFEPETMAAIVKIRTAVDGAFEFELQTIQWGTLLNDECTDGAATQSRSASDNLTLCCASVTEFMGVFVNYTSCQPNVACLCARTGLSIYFRGQPMHDFNRGSSMFYLDSFSIKPAAYVLGNSERKRGSGMSHRIPIYPMKYWEEGREHNAHIA
ncbi:hypothetical protein GQR58_013382 [Nymphon striatum]|nr:hypothetical protein GQR58_013382 [Nymphon striatum]